MMRGNISYFEILRRLSSDSLKITQLSFLFNLISFYYRPEQYHFFYPNTNTQYFQRGLNNTQYQYQFFEEALTIPNTNTNIHEGS